MGPCRSLVSPPVRPCAPTTSASAAPAPRGRGSQRVMTSRPVRRPGPRSAPSRTARSRPSPRPARSARSWWCSRTPPSTPAGSTTAGVGAVLARFDFGVTIFFVLSGFLRQPAVVPRGDSASPRPRCGTTSGSGPCASCRCTGSWWSWRCCSTPRTRAPTGGTGSSNLTLTQLYRPGLLPSSLTQMWSLCTEVAFYLLLPLVCLC